MNKYYIAWPLPEAFTKAFVHAQGLVSDWLLPDTKRTPEQHLHITALYIGKMPTTQAEELMTCLSGSTAIEAELDKVEVFRNRRGPNALVVKLKDRNGHMLRAHNLLMSASGIRSDFAFNPHVTLAKIAGFPDMGMGAAAAMLNDNYPFKGAEVTLDKVALYEKPEALYDNDYEVRLVHECREQKSF